MGDEERGREEGGRFRLAARVPCDPPIGGLRDPLPAVQLMLPCKPLLPLTTAALQLTNQTSSLKIIGW